MAATARSRRLTGPGADPAVSLINNPDTANLVNPEELERFRSIRRLRNHWSRPIGPRSYYWYLTFEDCHELQSLARKCQKAISFPYYDLTPPRDLHMTLDKIAFDGDLTLDQLHRIEAIAACACREIQPFDVTIGPLSGTPGAIGFSVSPIQPIRELRNKLRQATLSVYPEAPVTRSEFHPHIAIAYANSDVPAAEAIAALNELNTVAFLKVTIEEGALVLLKRHQRSYAWQAVSRVQFGPAYGRQVATPKSECS
jgi:2'-5' RNA ligase